MDDNLDKKNRLVVYTTIFGSYDHLIEPDRLTNNLDLICFTDQDQLSSKNWKIIHVDNEKLDPLMLNRRYKILPHIYLPDYETSIYIDANIAISGNISNLAQTQLARNSFLLPRHFARNCIYQEAMECIFLGLADRSRIEQQMMHYRQMGMPENFGLGENNILIRNHNQDNVIAIMEEWWKQFQKFDTRDQLSLAYTLWKMEKKFYFIDENARSPNIFFHRLHHRNMNAFKRFIRRLKYEFRKVTYTLIGTRK